MNIQNATAEQAQEMAKGAGSTKESSEAMKSMGGFGAILLKVILGIGAGLLAIAAASKIFKLMNKGGVKTLFLNLLVILGLLMYSKEHWLCW